MSRKRSGRPKSNRSAVDYGTPELVMKRMRISPTDATLSTCPIDMLLARNLISKEHHAAAVHFRACRLVTFGSPHAKATNLLQISGMSVPHEGIYQERSYRSACTKLKNVSRQHFDAIENLVIHERWPDWVRQPGRLHGRARCMEALTVLAKWHDDLPKQEAAA